MCVSALAGTSCDLQRDKLAAIEQEIRSHCDETSSLHLDTPGGVIRTHARYELTELRRDLLFADAGIDALLSGADLSENSTQVDAAAGGRSGPRDEPAAFPCVEEATALAEELSGRRFALLVSDRDGTVNGYSARYTTAVQPAWSAFALTRFTSFCCDRSIVLTAGPLRGPGIADLSTMPVEASILAGSKGREFRLESGQEVRETLPERGADALGRFNAHASRLAEESRFALLAYVGSGIQRKHGMTAVGYQDAVGTVPDALAQEYRAAIIEAVSAADRDGSLLGWEDTGRDIEVSLREGVAADHGFDKGDGVSSLLKRLSLTIKGKSVLVCGDTASDVPMLEHAVRAGARCEAIFAAVDRGVESRVRDLCPSAHFVSRWESLVLAMNMLVREAEYEFDMV